MSEAKADERRMAPSTLARRRSRTTPPQPCNPALAPLRPLRPAPGRSSIPSPAHSTCFYDLPPELRIEIYKLALAHVKVHILPRDANGLKTGGPHPLVRTSRQVRAEVTPLVHAFCGINAVVTDFNFTGLLDWLSRIPPQQHANLCKNAGLRIQLCTSLQPQSGQYGEKLRKWLHLRADEYRPQPRWRYEGPVPQPKVAADLKRRIKRMTEEGKKKELKRMCEALGVTI